MNYDFDENIKNRIKIVREETDLFIRHIKSICGINDNDVITNISDYLEEYQVKNPEDMIKLCILLTRLLRCLLIRIKETENFLKNNLKIDESHLNELLLNTINMVRLYKFGFIYNYGEHQLTIKFKEYEAWIKDIRNENTYNIVTLWSSTRYNDVIQKVIEIYKYVFDRFYRICGNTYTGIEKTTTAIKRPMKDDNVQNKKRL